MIRIFLPNQKGIKLKYINTICFSIVNFSILAKPFYFSPILYCMRLYCKNPDLSPRTNLDMVWDGYKTETKASFLFLHTTWLLQNISRGKTSKALTFFNLFDYLDPFPSCQNYFSSLIFFCDHSDSYKLISSQIFKFVLFSNNFFSNVLIYAIYAMFRFLLLLYGRSQLKNEEEAGHFNICQIVFDHICRFS